MKVSFIVLSTFLFSLCVGQQRTSDAVKQSSIQLDLGSSHFKDENLHPKVFRGLNFGTSYAHSKSRRNISEYSTGLNIAFLNTAFEEFPSALSILLQANYRYLFLVFSNEKMAYHFGPLTDLQYGTNAYFNWDESHLYHANYLGEGVSNRVSYQLGQYNFGFHLDFPVLSVISRPAPNRQYKIDDLTFTGIMKNLASNQEFALPDKNFFIRAGIELHVKSKRMKNRSVGYNFLYHRMKATDGEPYQQARHTLVYKFFL